MVMKMLWEKCINDIRLEEGNLQISAKPMFHSTESRLEYAFELGRCIKRTREHKGLNRNELARGTGLHGRTSPSMST